MIIMQRKDCASFTPAEGDNLEILKDPNIIFRWDSEKGHFKAWFVKSLQKGDLSADEALEIMLR